MISLVEDCSLFEGIEENQLTVLLNCLTPVRLVFAKDAFIFHTEDKADSVGIVLEGSVNIIQEDFWGNRMILTHVGPGELFAEAFSCAGTNSLPVSVVAAEKSEIMLIDYRKIVSTCSSACVFHTHLIMNMMRILAEKNILLIRKLEYLSQRTTREKLLSFLSAQAVREKSEIVELPFNRQELADFLCVDRSALSRELTLMQKDGLIQYDKNRFILLLS